MPTCGSCGKHSSADFRFCPECGAPVTTEARAREVRKTVTVLFCDLVGSTTLAETHDPEVLKPVLQRYFEEMREAVERHGGRVEKFIGDAVVAIFGVPQVHEDDALRAVRAAAAMRDRLATVAHVSSVELLSRIGLTTGEVLVAGEDQPPIGDAMNTAARLQSSAAPGQILIGEPTYRLVQDAVVAEPVKPLALKGKAEPVPAYALLQVASLSPMRTRRLDAPMVGRTRERVLLQQAFERASSDRMCQLFTVLGAAGAGKSRLVEEFLSGVDEASLLRGRCLPYGEGITYFPVTEALKGALGLADFDDESSVRARIHAAVAEADHAEAITANLAKLLAAGEGGTPEETFWAIRRFLEVLGRERPVVVVFDDIHWGEPSFLDLVEHVAEWSRDAQVLLLCMARPDLLDVRPGWAGGMTNAATISLAPLSEAECSELIDHLVGASELPEGVRDKITHLAEGNPLFVEEMLRMLIDDGLLVREGPRWAAAGELGEVSVPPTISALLSARLDRLSGEERTVIGAAAVCGKEFHRGAILDLIPDGVGGNVDVHLRSLVRRELVGPERSLLPGEDAYRFRHLLIRDAAYDAIPKQERADLHEAFANWLERVAGDRVEEQEEILGYHLEQAHRYRTELAPTDESEGELARRGSAHLAAAGRRAAERGDASGAAALLGRAAGLTLTDDPGRGGLLLEHGTALADAGELPRAIEVLEEAIASATATRNDSTEWRARVEQVWVRTSVETELAWGDEQRRLAEAAIQVFERLGDDVGLAKAWFAMADVHNLLGNQREMVASGERSLWHARKAGRSRETTMAAVLIHSGMFFGSTPIREALPRLRELHVEFGHLPSFRLWGVFWGVGAGGSFEALRGNFDKALAFLDEWADVAREYGDRWALTRVAWSRGGVGRLAGDPVAAEGNYRAAFETFSSMGERGRLSTLSGELALALADQGRHEEALQFAETSRKLGGPDDAATQMVWRQARARALAGLGELREAERTASEAVAIGRDTDFWWTGDALVTLAEVLRISGRPEEALPLVEEAVEIYERKGAVPPLERAQAMLAALTG